MLNICHKILNVQNRLMVNKFHFSNAGNDFISYFYCDIFSDESTTPPRNPSYSDISICVQESRWMRWFTERFVTEVQLDSNGAIKNQWVLNYREAAIYLEEGENNIKFTHHPHLYESLPIYLLCHNHVFYIIDLIACLFILMLAFFEKPAVGGLRMPEFGHATIELVLLGFISVMFLAKLKWMGWRHAVTHWRTIIKCTVLVLMIVEAVVVLIREDSHFRVTRSMRPVFIIDNFYLGAVRRVIRQMIQSLKAFLDMLLLLVFFMLLFAISGFYLFSSIPKYADFDTLWDSFISLFVLLTTAK